MSQKWKMCLVSERGQTRAWIFITCTATRWRRPIHQAELSGRSQTFPIKTPSPAAPPSLPLTLWKQEVHPHGRKERGESEEKQGGLFCTVMNFKNSSHSHFDSLSMTPLTSPFFSHYCLLSFSEPDLAYFWQYFISILLWPALWTVRKGRTVRRAARQLREILE